MRLTFQAAVAAAFAVVLFAMGGVADAASSAASTVGARTQATAASDACTEPPPSVAPYRVMRTLGPWRIDTGLAATYARAAAAFGPPARRWASGRNDMRIHAVWNGPRAMHVVFAANHPPNVTDDYAAAFFLKATLTGPAWRTWKGVRIGQRVGQLTSQHRTAWKVRSGQWSIADYCSNAPDTIAASKVSLLGVFRTGRLAELRVRSPEADLQP